MEPFYGSVQANAKRAHWNLEETRESLNGQSISVKKRKEKPKPQATFMTSFQLFFCIAYCKHTLAIGLLGIICKYPVQVKVHRTFFLHPPSKGKMFNLDTYRSQKERVY